MTDQIQEQNNTASDLAETARVTRGVPRQRPSPQARVAEANAADPTEIVTQQLGQLTLANAQLTARTKKFVDLVTRQEQELQAMLAQNAMLKADLENTRHVIQTLTAERDKHLEREALAAAHALNSPQSAPVAEKTED